MSVPLLKVYRFLFARRRFYRFNRLVYRLGLSGLGVLNYESDRVSGEAAFLKGYFRQRPGGVILDVGANIGNYSKAVLSLNPDARLYAFEPHPRTYEKLTENLRGRNFNAINVALGESDGVLSLYDRQERDGSPHASLYRQVIEDIHKSDVIEHKVPVIRLGAFLREHGIEAVSLLKIDTEGNELNVLRSVEAYLEAGKINAIQFEFNEMNAVSRTYFMDFWNLLKNYDFYRLLPGGMLKIESYSPVLCEIFAYQNIVALLKST